MKITKEWLKEESACRDGYEWSLKRKGIVGGIEAGKFLDLLIKDDKLDWANWVIVRVMTRAQYLAYSIFAAEQVIGIYEKKYPNNKAPRAAIEAAKAVLENDNEETRENARIKRNAYAAYAAADAAAYAAAYAAYAAADAAAYAAADAAAYAADAAADAADADARKEMRLRILNYGIELLDLQKVEVNNVKK